jgi:hypothetical protein
VPLEGYPPLPSTERYHIPLASKIMPHSKDTGIPLKPSSGNESKNQSQASLEENEERCLDHHVDD